MESEETQDCVRAYDLNHEESEEISFVPSAISVPQVFCLVVSINFIEKTISFWQFASMSQPLYASNDSLVAKRR